MKKLKIRDPELIKILINKMLEKHGVDYEYIKLNEIIEDRLWCAHYSWTEQECQEYKKWWIKFFQENVSPRKLKKVLEKEWLWFNLMWGLRVDNENRL
jgi:hypothetical protein